MLEKKQLQACSMVKQFTPVRLARPTTAPENLQITSGNVLYTQSQSHYSFVAAYTILLAFTF